MCQFCFVGHSEIKSPLVQETFVEFFKIKNKQLEEISLFAGVTDIPVLDFRGCLDTTPHYNVRVDLLAGVLHHLHAMDYSHSFLSLSPPTS